MLQMYKNKYNLLIDVREKKYFDYAHIPNSINIPMSEIEKLDSETLKKIKDASNIIVYCTSTSC